MDNVHVNVELTGIERAGQGLRDFSKGLEQTGAAQEAVAKSAKTMAGELSAASTAVTKMSETVVRIDDALKGMRDSLVAATSSIQALTTAAAAGTGAVERQSGAMNNLSGSSRRAAGSNRDFTASEDEMIAPTLLQTQALEAQTRKLILNRDATLKAMTAQQNWVERLASSAPKLSKFSLYIAGGVAGAAYAGIRQYMDFNKQMTQTFSQANVELSKQKALTTNVRDIVKETGRNYHDVADALYRVASATSAWHGGKGATTQELTALTRETANLQVLGNLQTGAQSDQASRVIGAIANANLKDFSGITNPTKRAHAIGAAVNAVVGAGDLRMTDLISALGRGVEASAKSVGVSFKDTGAFIDLLTSRGVSGSSAGTYVAHAFQLLAGSTKQGRDWQAAMGLGSGEMLHIMQSKGLAPAVETLASHMTQLKSVEYMRYGGLTGQAAAEKMMIAAGLDPALVKDWESGALKDPSRRKDLKAVEQAAMTAMFGGGRQAMPIISLIQATKKGSFQDIVKKVQETSNQATYNKDVKLAMNTPAQQQAQILRKLQDQLISFGSVMQKYWIGALKVVSGILGFMNKFKSIWAELAVIAGGILLATGAKYGAKLAIGVKNSFGALSYGANRATAAAAERLGGEAYAAQRRAYITGNAEDAGARRSWAGQYAEKNKLAYSQLHQAQIEQVRVANEEIARAESFLEAAGSMENSMSLVSTELGRAAGAIGDAIFRIEQIMARPQWANGGAPYLRGGSGFNSGIPGGLPSGMLGLNDLKKQKLWEAEQRRAATIIESEKMARLGLTGIMLPDQYMASLQTNLNSGAAERFTANRIMVNAAANRNYVPSFFTYNLTHQVDPSAEVGLAAWSASHQAAKGTYGVGSGTLSERHEAAYRELYGTPVALGGVRKPVQWRTNGRYYDPAIMARLENGPLQNTFGLPGYQGMNKKARLQALYEERTQPISLGAKPMPVADIATGVEKGVKTLTEETVKNGSKFSRMASGLSGVLSSAGGALSGMGSAVGGGLMAGGRGLLGMGGRLLGGLMGPWGMAATMLAPIAIPAISSVVTNIFNRKRRKPQDTNVTAPTISANEQQIKDLQKQRQDAKARQDWKAYNHLGTQIKNLRNENKFGVQFGQELMGTKHALETTSAVDNLLKSYNPITGKFEYGGNAYDRVKIGKKDFFADDVKTVGWTRMGKRINVPAHFARGIDEYKIYRKWQDQIIPQDEKFKTAKDWQHVWQMDPNTAKQHLNKLAKNVDFKKNANFKNEFTGKVWENLGSSEKWIADAFKHPGYTATNKSRYEYMLTGASQLNYSQKLERFKSQEAWNKGNWGEAKIHQAAADKLKAASDKMKENAEKFAHGAKFKEGEIDKMGETVGGKTAEKVGQAVKEAMNSVGQQMGDSVARALASGARFTISNG